MKLISKISIVLLLLTATIACKEPKKEVDTVKKTATEEIVPEKTAIKKVVPEKKETVEAKLEAATKELDDALKTLEKEAKELDDALKTLEDI